MKARTIKTGWDRLAHTPLPAISRWHDDFVVIARAGADAVLLHQPSSQKTQRLTRQEFELGWNGELILVAKRGFSSDPSSLFGFGWFVPALLKYRRLLGEVLLASFRIHSVVHRWMRCAYPPYGVRQVSGRAM